MPGLVLLLKEARGSEESDPYCEVLTAAGYECAFIPVLGHVLRNQLQLRAAIEEQQYSGIIFTSQRAVEAWKEALPRVRSQTCTNWRDAPCYVVGPTTASMLQAIEGQHAPRVVCGAEQSGTSETLAGYITTRLAAAAPAHPLLYLTGDKRRENLPDILSKASIPLEELVVYETAPLPDFSVRFRASLDRLAEVESAWIALFSPSGANLALPILHETGLAGRVKLATIGPTTRDHLADVMQLQAHAMAATPQAADLANAIKRTDAKPA